MKRILAIGNALVDVLMRIDSDTILHTLGLSKGSMTLINKGKMNAIYERVRDIEKTRSSGGSAANTVIGLARMGVPAGFIGKTGDDEYGHFYRQEMESIQIEPFISHGNEVTGRCTVFISADSERTFATYLGSAAALDASDLRQSDFEAYDYVHLEGYLVANPGLITKALELAVGQGCRVALDLSSFNVVEAHREFLASTVGDAVDLVFANEEEARAFTGAESPQNALTAIAEMCDIAVVKLGSKGSLIKSKHYEYRIQPVKADAVDTTGAGDLFAAGFYYGLSKGYPLDVCGQIASLVGARVVEVIGARLADNDWDDLNRKIKNIETGP